MVSREGMETALLLMQLRETLHLALGAAIGVVGAAGVAWLWSRYGHRVNLALFFQVTAIFLFVFVVQLADRGRRTKCRSRATCRTAMHPRRAPNRGDPTAPFGHLLTYLLVILPLGWLLLKALVLEAPGLRRPAAADAAPVAAAHRAEQPMPHVSHSAARTIRVVPKPPTVVDLTWIGDLKFAGTQRHGPRSTLDSAGVAGPSPVQALALRARRLHGDGRRVHPDARDATRSARLRSHLVAERAQEDPHRIVTHDAALHRRRRRAARRRRARDRAVAREVLFGVALDAAGHRVHGDVERHRLIRLEAASGAPTSTGRAASPCC